MFETREMFSALLLGKDLRTVKQNTAVMEAVTDQQSFDELFTLVFHHERPLVMKAIDAVEKITAKYPQFLQPHKIQLLSVLKGADHKELKWHIAQLLPRVDLSADELLDVVHVLTYWALNKNESKIVRVNALQGLFDLANIHHDLKPTAHSVMVEMEHELIPSIQARIRKLRKSFEKS